VVIVNYLLLNDIHSIQNIVNFINEGTKLYILNYETIFLIIYIYIFKFLIYCLIAMKNFWLKLSIKN